MGRRKKSSAKKIVANKKPSIPKHFKCPFCNHENAVVCVMDWKRHVGELKCRICGAEYQTSISYLSEAIDVYSEWIDECERVNDPGGEHDDYDEEHDRALPRSSAAVAQGRDEVEDDEEDLF
mmetsp:Transcript_11264/g.42046  ORF Transcript_11264/g.42046 Transcript_11264/m.42046 type:complete len:122 (-) Transcript_11264:66-431(-)